MEFTVFDPITSESPNTSDFTVFSSGELAYVSGFLPSKSCTESKSAISTRPNSEWFVVHW